MNAMGPIRERYANSNDQCPMTALPTGHNDERPIGDRTAKQLIGESL